MDLSLIIVILSFIVVILALFIFFILIKIKPKQESVDSIKLLQQYIFDLNKTFDFKLSQTNKTLEDKLFRNSEILDRRLWESSRMLNENITKNFNTSSQINLESNKTIEQITKKLSELDETNKQIKDIWQQLSWLENILKNPKQRWNLWEYFLKELLENVFNSEQYKLQYNIKDIWVVDAALFIWWRIIPIDSKFPQENYDRLIKSQDEFSIKKYSTDLKRDIQNRINETSKYISEENGTVDFAFMLIPAEWLYYDLFINKIWDLDPRKLIEYAFSKKVIICSPSGFYAYLQTVIQAMKSLKIEEQAKEIQKYVIKLQKDLENYNDVFWKIWISLWTTVNHYNNAQKRLSIIDKDIFKISSWEIAWNFQISAVDKPNF